MLFEPSFVIPVALLLLLRTLFVFISGINEKKGGSNDYEQTMQDIS